MFVGDVLGTTVGAAEGRHVGVSVGRRVGISVGSLAVGTRDGDEDVGNRVGLALDGTLLGLVLVGEELVGRRVGKVVAGVVDGEAMGLRVFGLVGDPYREVGDLVFFFLDPFWGTDLDFFDARTTFG